MNIVLGNYIGHLLDSGQSYSSINTKKSAISVTYRLTTGVQLGKDQIVAAIMRGVNMKVPAKARYEEAWDIEIILKFFRKWKRNSQLTTIELRTKASVLLMIALIARGDDVWKLRFPHATKKRGVITFTTVERLKNQGLKKVVPLQIRRKRNDSKICPYRAYTSYIARIEGVRSEDSTRIFLSARKPFGELSKDRISNSVTKLLHRAGVPERYKCHSIKMAVATKLIEQGVPVADVMALGRWLSINVFNRFYNRAKMRANIMELLSK